MQGLDIETTALRPEDGRVRLVQIRDGERGWVYGGRRPEVPDALRGLNPGRAQRPVRARVGEAALRHRPRPRRHDGYVASALHRHGRGEEQAILAQPAGG